MVPEEFLTRNSCFSEVFATKPKRGQFRLLHPPATAFCTGNGQRQQRAQALSARPYYGFSFWVLFWALLRHFHVKTIVQPHVQGSLFHLSFCSRELSPAPPSPPPDARLAAGGGAPGGLRPQRHSQLGGLTAPPLPSKQTLAGTRCLPAQGQPRTHPAAAASAPGGRPACPGAAAARSRR